MDSGSLPPVPWPSLHPVRSLEASAPPVADAADVARQAVHNVAWEIPAGVAVAVCVGSRGVSNYAAIVRAVVDALKERGATPFIVPAMGSHGGATAQAQEHLLAEYGIDEQHMGAPVRSAMDTVPMGTTPSGMETFMDRRAYEAGRVVLVNRVKPHTSFVAPVESGLMKMLAVGLGKLDGARHYHMAAMRIGFETALLESARLLLASGKVLGGVAIIENDRHQTSGVFATTGAEMETNERQWLARAREIRPRLPFDELDLLIVDEMGKDIAGTGMDTRVVGRSVHPEPDHAGSLGDLPGYTRVRRLYVRDLTPAAEGNATGVGMADIIHERLFHKIDFRVTYMNIGTSLSYVGGRIPVHFSSDRAAIEFCLRNLGLPTPDRVRAVRIRNTLAMETILASQACARLLRGNPAYEVTKPQPMEFDAAGNLV